MSAAPTTLVAPASPAGEPLNPLALRLGYAGLLPFLFGALLVWLLSGYDAEAHAFATLALSSYAAVVISFLGGIHWGLGFRQGGSAATPFVWGVVPSLMAWVAVVMPAYAGLVVHGVMLVVCYLVDRRLYPQLGAAPWLTLRFRLSGVASLSCFLGAAAS